MVCRENMGAAPGKGRKRSAHSIQPCYSQVTGAARIGPVRRGDPVSLAAASRQDPMARRSHARLAAAAVLPLAGTAQAAGPLELTSAPIGIAAVVVFVLAYAFVVLEERLHLRKS